MMNWFPQARTEEPSGAVFRRFAVQKAAHEESPPEGRGWADYTLENPAPTAAAHSDPGEPNSYASQS